MTDVVSNLKVKDPCPCGHERCNKFGSPLAGKRGHVRGCPCPKCMGARNRKKGDDRARVVRKQLGLGGVNTRHEELWGGTSRTEVKAGGKAKPVMTAYEHSRAQSELARSHGDTRPFIAGFAPDATKHVYYVIRDDDLEAAAFALAETWGYGEARHGL